jgi:hypothetical protein
VHADDPDFSAEVVDELYQYRFKSYPIAGTLAVVAGVFGAHRFYLGKTLTGILMLLSFGGGLIWWILDLFRLQKLVKAFNKEEHNRQDSDQPPQGLGFLPPKRDLDLSAPPVWIRKRGGRFKVASSAFALSVFGLSIGAVTGATGNYEPLLIILVFIAVTLTAARWKSLAHVPVLHGLSRWNHRLRLYYHTVDPGSIWLLALRPITGIFIAPWRSRARAEVRLYLQLGVVFSILFTLSDTLELSESDSLAEGLGLMLGEFVQTLIYTYAFVAPIGALLITQLLLSQRDSVVWTLSALTVLAICSGLMTVGAL